MFELIAFWMVIGLFCAGFWLVMGASRGLISDPSQSTLEVQNGGRTKRRELRT